MNDLEKLKPYLKNFLEQEFSVYNLDKNFRCITGRHLDRHPSMRYHKEDFYVKCFACGFVGNIITVGGLRWNCNMEQSFQKLKERYLLANESVTRSDYLSMRGLTPFTIEHFGVQIEDNFQVNFCDKDGKNKSFSMGTVVKVPSDSTTSCSYLIRSISQKKFYKPYGITESLFFAYELDQLEPVFVVESVFCAMILWQCGKHAVALNGLGWRKLVEELEQREIVPPLILSLDKDCAGEKAANALYDVLVEKYIVINYPVSGLYKDPNEAYLSDKAAFLLELENAIQAIKSNGKPSNLMIDYISYSFLEELEKTNLTVLERRTGFQMLDRELGGLVEGLYIIGGRPGVGKTTFLDQLAYQVSSETPVLYFSYEQQKIHFAAKQLSRLSYLESDTPFCSKDLLKGKIPDNLPDIMELYVENAHQIHVYSEQYSVEQLLAKIEQFENRCGKAPIVIIDFIQKIPVPSKNSAKDSIDYVVSKLEQFTHQGRRTVLLVSSFNRAGYYSPITLESFRESGNLEYAADFLLGFQYQTVLTDPVFLSDGKMTEKQLLIKQAEEKEIRTLSFSCVKRRYGNLFHIPMQYHTKYDYFTEATIQQKKRHRI